MARKYLPLSAWVVWLSDYTAIMNLMVKVLDFVQLGGPNLTVDSTIFEMFMRL